MIDGYELAKVTAIVFVGGPVLFGCLVVGMGLLCDTTTAIVNRIAGRRIV